jgi:VanZ family protein
MPKVVNLWAPVVLWMMVIFAFSAMAINGPAKFSWLDFVVKKSAHVTEYAILYWLVWRATSESGRRNSTKTLILSLIFSLVYALSDEWHQTITPGREGTLRDVGFDTLGMLLALNFLRKNA